ACVRNRYGEVEGCVWVAAQSDELVRAGRIDFDRVEVDFEVRDRHAPPRDAANDKVIDPRNPASLGAPRENAEYRTVAVRVGLHDMKVSDPTGARHPCDRT